MGPVLVFERKRVRFGTPAKRKTSCPNPRGRRQFQAFSLQQARASCPVTGCIGPARSEPRRSRTLVDRSSRVLGGHRAEDARLPHTDGPGAAYLAHYGETEVLWLDAAANRPGGAG